MRDLQECTIPAAPSRVGGGRGWGVVLVLPPAQHPLAGGEVAFLLMELTWVPATYQFVFLLLGRQWLFLRGFSDSIVS